MNHRLHTWIEWILRLAFCIILIYAGYEKIIHPTEFAKDVENYRVIGPLLSEWTAIWIPTLECILGVLLIVGFWKKPVAFINLCLMAIFLILVTQAAIRGLDIECGCFGQESQKIGTLKVFENFLFLAGSAALYWLIRKQESLAA